MMPFDELLDLCTDNPNRRDIADELKPLYDEMERLRKEVEFHDSRNDIDLAARDDEIERLRAELASFKQPVPMSEWQKLVAERDALKDDAERYRWLRQVDRCEAWENLLMVRPITRTEDIDAAIDAARGKP